MLSGNGYGCVGVRTKEGVHEYRPIDEYRDEYAAIVCGKSDQIDKYTVEYVWAMTTSM